MRYYFYIIKQAHGFGYRFLVVDILFERLFVCFLGLWLLLLRGAFYHGMEVVYELVWMMYVGNA